MARLGKLLLLLQARELANGDPVEMEDNLSDMDALT